jgi:2-polyprenyl-3-methyl-5-hydroxy-6-metoxy-1,4-benzoquinol methylase
MTQSDAVAYHTRIASEFDARYSQSPLFKERLAIWTQVLQQQVPPGGTVLDCGCGSGVFSLVAARFAGSVMGFDGSEAMIRLASAKVTPELASRIRFEVARLEDMARFGEGAFDVAFASSVLEYVDDLPGALRLMVQSLKPGGVLIASMPNGASLYRHLERAAFALTGRPAYLATVRHIPSPRRFRSVMEGAGLGTIAQRSYAAPPVFGSALRAVGLASRSDTLMIYTGRKPGA